MDIYKDNIIDYRVKTYPIDLPCSLIVDKIARGDIIIPMFQRNYVWNIMQASRLIESLLLDIPIPQIFVYSNDEAIMEVIDGQQRILSVKYFMDGEFDNGLPFHLTNMTILSSLDGMAYSDLPSHLKRKIQNSYLRFLCVETDSKYKDDIILNIFSRLNVGGTSLTTQEVRNAIYHSPFIEMLRYLSENEDWLRITSGKINSKRAMDIEVILRIYSFHKYLEEYQPPLNSFLNHILSIESTLSKRKVNNYYKSSSNIPPQSIYKEHPLDIYDDFKDLFTVASNSINLAIEKPFFINNRFRKVFLESFLIGLMSNGMDGIFSAGSTQNIAQAHESLSNNAEFEILCSSKVNEHSSLLKRLDMVKDAIFR